jgi:hypothetical protein
MGKDAQRDTLYSVQNIKTSKRKIMRSRCLIRYKKK